MLGQRSGNKEWCCALRLLARLQLLRLLRRPAWAGLRCAAMSLSSCALVETRTERLKSPAPLRFTSRCQQHIQVDHRLFLRLTTVQSNGGWFRICSRAADMQ